MTPAHDTDDRHALRTAKYEAVRAHLYELTGISLGDNKRDMAASRLAKRLRHHGLTSYGAYLELVRRGTHPDERQEFINCLTTNKTDFFREAHHFAFLRDTLVPQLGGAGPRRLRIWCAASSTGEEPYTLALTAREACPPADGWDVKVLASDIDTRVLAHAARGVYEADRAAGIPPDLLRKHFLRGTGANAGKVAARPELKSLLTFRQINLVDDRWPVRGPLDAIFCRNVMIYFDRDTQDRLIRRFAALLAPGGHLFLGHSENIHWLHDVFEPLGGTMYRLRGGPDAPPPARPRSVPAVAAAPPLPRPRPAAPAEPEYGIILGDVQATQGPAVIKTLLGSCVAACLWDPETGIGGMNHFSLPGAPDDGANARYGAFAMELLITAIMKKGGDRDRLRAKVFGGARVIDVSAPGLNIGERNAEFVLKFLETEGIPLAGQSLGGTRGRLVRFRPHTGQAQVKPLAGRELPAVVARETAHERDLKAQVQAKAEAPADDGITLF